MPKNATLADASPKNPALEESKPLADFLGNDLVIEGYENIGKIGANECVIVRTDKGKLSSFSGVVIDQLKSMQSNEAKKDFDHGFTFKVRFVKEKQYYKFEDLG